MLESHREQRNIEDIPSECVPFFLLSQREREVLQHIADGHSLEETRQLMGVSRHAVDKFKQHIGDISMKGAHEYHITNDYPNQAHIAILALIQDGITHGYLTHVPPEQPIQPLRPREIEILYLLSQGKLQTEIVKKICVSQKTVSTDIAHVYNKLHTRDIYHTVARATYLKVNNMWSL